MDGARNGGYYGDTDLTTAGYVRILLALVALGVLGAIGNRMVVL